MLRADAERHVEIRAGDPGCTGAAEHDLHLFDLLAGQFERVQQGRSRDDSRAVLVVVKHRDVEFGLQGFLDVETLGRLDVFEVDPPEGGRQVAHRTDHLVGILGIEFDVKHVDVGEALEQYRLPFHHRLTGQGADIAEAQYRRAVADHADQVAAGRITTGHRWIFLDLQTRLRHTGRVSQREIVLSDARFGRYHFNLALTALFVVFEGGPLEAIGMYLVHYFGCWMLDVTDLRR